MNDRAMVPDTFPRQQARTQRLTLGEPRNITVSPDGRRIVFARSASGHDSLNKLWVLDVETAHERCVFDPTTLHNDADVTAEEKRRRERMREAAGGVVTYSTDASVTKALTTVGGHTYLVNLVNGNHHNIPIGAGAFDARLSPDGDTIAFVRDGALCMYDSDGTERVLCADSSPDVTWGLAEFIAAEEMGRQRGFWFSPDGKRLAVCRVDTSQVVLWNIADPSRPETMATTHRYPKAGSTNATVSLHVVSVEDGSVVDVALPPAFEYLNSVSWASNGLIAQVQTRDQRRTHVVRIDALSGTCDVIHEDVDSHWVELVPGTPALAANGSLVTCADRDGLRRLMIDGQPVTPTDLQVRTVAYVGRCVLFTANDIEQPWFCNLWRHDIESGHQERLGSDRTVTSGVGNDACVVLRTTSVESPLAVHTVIDGPRLATFAEEPLVSPNVRFHTVGPRRIPVAVLTPRTSSTERLPVLFDPYGGPHAQRVLASTQSLAVSQWFADQGFVVVIADGAGTPGKGSTYEREVFSDLAEPVLRDQMLIASTLPDLEPRADMTRVAIRGWSFGGYLAALAVLRAPEVFHCGVAGAPVTDWHLYDTHYTERYLGDPTRDGDNYERTNLVLEASRLTRPLLLIHGLADDNVVAAHTLHMSSALLAAGRAHEVLPLSGVTHMTPQEVVAENLLLHQLDFIRRSLGLDD